MATIRQRRGADAENVAVAWLARHGWRVLARNVKVGRHDEIDIVALDPGSPAELVCVEVRSARSADFGAPEERVGQRKVTSLYRGARAFSRSEMACDLGVGLLTVRVDLVVIDARTGTPEIRYVRGIG